MQCILNHTYALNLALIGARSALHELLLLCHVLIASTEHDANDIPHHRKMRMQQMMAVESSSHSSCDTDGELVHFSRYGRSNYSY